MRSESEADKRPKAPRTCELAQTELRDTRDLPAGTEDDLVRLEAALGTHQGHVDEHLRVQQRLEGL